MMTPMTTTSTPTRLTPLIVCPACLRPTLQPGIAESLLPSRRCATCAGQFIRSEHYYRWLEHPDRTPQTECRPDQVSEVVDSPKAKICPECGKLMRRCRVGRGAEFAIDRCGGCGGMWLDANEWESLKHFGLHDRVHFVFSDAWQAGLLRQERDDAARRHVEARLGPSDFAELQRVTQWINQHPHREEVTAYLLTRLRDGGAASS